MGGDLLKSCYYGFYRPVRRRLLLPGHRGILMAPAELIRLDRPPADYCLAVGGLAPALEVSKLEACLIERGGPLWSLLVHEDSSGGERRWAMVFFYCESDCERCRHQCDGLVLAGRRLSTRRLTKLRSNHPAAGREGIPASKAIDLMNHYVGFNQWSSQLLHVGPAADERPSTCPPQPSVFAARMRVSVAGGLEVTAEATDGGIRSDLHGESSVTNVAVEWERRAQQKKASVTNALKAALAKLCIIRLPNGKVVVRVVEDSTKQRPAPCRANSSWPVPSNPSMGLQASTLAPTGMVGRSTPCVDPPQPHALRDHALEVD